MLISLQQSSRKLLYSGNTITGTPEVRFVANYSATTRSGALGIRLSDHNIF